MSTQHTIINIRKKITLNYVCIYKIFSWRSKNEFEIAVVNETSVFEPLKFSCKCFSGNSVFKAASSPLENVSYNTMMFSAMNLLKKTGQPAMDSLPLATWRVPL